MENIKTQSEFNSSISTLNRINYLFFMCNEYSSQLDVYNWFHHLLIIRRELFEDMKPEQKREINNIKNELSKIINNNLQNKNYHIDPQLYDKIDKFELFLREIFDSSGMRIKRSEDARFAL